MGAQQPEPVDIRRMPLKRRTGWLRRHFDLRPRKSLGQNFLLDETAAGRIVEAAMKFSPREVMEIGAGLGALTVPLADADYQIIAFETDPTLARALRWLFADVPAVEIREEDFLQTDEQMGGERAVAVGNLPYYITSPILGKLLQSRPGFVALVVTVQYEVAQRLRAEPGTKQYGPLTLFCRYYAAQVSAICTLPPAAFWPQPEVKSMTLSLVARAEPPPQITEPVAFFAAVRGAFAHRRKTLRNSLRTADNLELTDEQTDAILAAAALDGQRRGETLDFDEFIRLGNALDMVTKQT